MLRRQVEEQGKDTNTGINCIINIMLYNHTKACTTLPLMSQLGEEGRREEKWEGAGERERDN
jgi:hypothetical protein